MFVIFKNNEGFEDILLTGKFYEVEAHQNDSVKINGRWLGLSKFKIAMV